MKSRGVLDSKIVAAVGWLAISIALLGSGVGGAEAVDLPASAAAAPASPVSADPAATLLRMFRWTGVIASFAVIAAAWLLLRFTHNLLERLSTVFNERRLQFHRFGAFFRFAVYFLAIVSITLLSFEISTEVLTILGGTAAVAIGFAAKDLVASVMSGLMIIFDRPFQVGDRVTFGGQYGDVVNIGLRSVKLRTLDDSIVTIPNNLFLNDVSSCGNYGVLNMQIMIDFLIGLDQDVRRAQEIIREVAATSCYIYLPNPVDVLVTQVANEHYVALRLRLKAYVLDTQFEKAFETDVTLRVMDTFKAEGIEPPAVLSRAIEGREAATSVAG